MLTNNGICTEQEKTNEINEKLQLPEGEQQHVSKMFVCHTFMGSAEFLEQYKAKTLLVTSYD